MRLKLQFIHLKIQSKLLLIVKKLRNELNNASNNPHRQVEKETQNLDYIKKGNCRLKIILERNSTVFIHDLDLFRSLPISAGKYLDGTELIKY
ncbi:hypothetical protein BpHYR1_036696 [Brachionus plicatilis]|uniref:Uncharacterized protein n=1 Tax=Brachionus plicatilis TaxID=10195 RepID=A0A3M7QTF5_BRAPC|nr:hypothetical protein BpHYR1_036696 [Brachionus plicatilis]